MKPSAERSIRMETKRLFLRHFGTSDEEEFKKLIRDKMSDEYAPYDEQFPTDNDGLAAMLGYFSQSDEFFAVEVKEGSRLIGFIALNRTDDDKVRNLGYCVHTAYRRRGYAGEAALAVIEYARNELGVKKLISGTALINKPSVRLLEKLCFRQTEISSGSFVNDKDGSPIVFDGASYELIL